MVVVAAAVATTAAGGCGSDVGMVGVIVGDLDMSGVGVSVSCACFSFLAQKASCQSMTASLKRSQNLNGSLQGEEGQDSDIQTMQSDEGVAQEFGSWNDYVELQRPNAGDSVSKYLVKFSRRSHTRTKPLETNGLLYDHQIHRYDASMKLVLDFSIHVSGLKLVPVIASARTVYSKHLEAY